ncbi:MAG: OmpA family protein [Myxococcales bacterium]|nr:MAG: OmpA family protein [Myxococcales bacterium]
MPVFRPLLLVAGIAVAFSGCASSGKSPLACVPIICSFVGERPAPPPPPPAPVVRRPAPAPAPPPAPSTQERLVLRGVTFATDSAQIDPGSAVVLDVAAEQLRARSGVNVVVEGHTDSTGSDAYNQQLSQRRADSVLGYLVRKGVPANRLTARGMGESSPVASNDTRDGRALNRRVELEVK